MTTPVTETYIQSGQVQRAILLCNSKRFFTARCKVISTSGTMTTARTVCVSSSVR